MTVHPRLTLLSLAGCSWVSTWLYMLSRRLVRRASDPGNVYPGPASETALKAARVYAFLATLNDRPLANHMDATALSVPALSIFWNPSAMVDCLPDDDAAAALA